MPAKTEVVLHWPSQNQERVVKKRVHLDGRYVDPRAKIDVPLHPAYSVNGGKRIHIDAERGVQVKYNGLNGWVGVPGRFSFQAEIDKILGQISSAKNQDLLLWMKVSAISAVIAVLGIVGWIIYAVKTHAA